MAEPLHFLSLADLDEAGLRGLIDRAEFSARKLEDVPGVLLAGRTLALVFEKPSTRTRVAFEAAAVALGGAGIYLDAQGSQLGRGEPIADTARVLSGYCSAIVYRTFGHERVLEMAAAASVPVINGLTDLLHPCQIVADLLTAKQALGEVEGLTYAWVGDGNNMAHSWLHAAGRLGLELQLACPEGFDPDPEVVATARAGIEALGHGRIDIVREPAKAVAGADVVSTDVWASMGQEEEARARRKAFAGYRVDAELMSKASDRAIVLHCLPAHRGEEITAEVLEGPRSRVWQQAENRLHAHKAILERSLVVGAVLE
jgi:ornithine carbamoyltransferase